ncbi:MAG TPA: hypothetical protein PLD20_33140 [Blastocatellia bacterium]|nr:hypothetical protein [Blastocatellia bacterium]HMV83825.1 hypothetical protein [Blastocatellia bacterium]HMX27219.1 hypothetical protein [Blastocatellia bacterium]HMY71738.1 hypothetical protein [Blastocatellia bacterium]HMZ22820.1 hypothetical protein [Blastocatellia bacterium]
MSTPFDPDAELIYIWAEILGETGKARFLLALDIGASHTMISHTPQNLNIDFRKGLITLS